MSDVGHGFLSRSYLALCMLKLHVVKHMPGLRQRLSRPLRTPWMRCVVGTQEATRAHDGGARARAHDIFYSHTDTRSLAHARLPRPLRPPRIGARTGRAVARAGAGSHARREVRRGVRGAGGGCGRPCGGGARNVEGRSQKREGGLTTRKRFFVTKTKHRFSTYLSARASSLDTLAGSCHHVGPF